MGQDHSLTAARTISLPPAASFASGQSLYIADESGTCNGETGLTITVSAAGSDMIDTADTVSG